MRVIKFIGLKVAEIGIFVLYVEGSYRFMFYANCFRDWNEMPLTAQYICAPLLMSSMLIFVGIFVFGIVQLIKLNWEWAE